MTRNYMQEMATLINAELNTPNCHARRAAQYLVEYLRYEDPELLAGFLDTQAVAIVAKTMEKVIRSRTAIESQVQRRSRIRDRFRNLEKSIMAARKN